jgi:hypothetical protein
MDVIYTAHSRKVFRQQLPSSGVYFFYLKATVKALAVLPQQ